MAQRATKFYQKYVTVKGKGTFPIDMLRYDNCVPASPYDAIAMQSEKIEDREIKLLMFCTEVSGVPEQGRWQSFGWEVVRINTV